MNRQIFLVTDRGACAGRPMMSLLAEAASAGVERIQVREKDLAGGALYELVCEVVRVCRPAGCRVFVNGRVDVALAAGADGVHLPSEGLTVAQARSACGGRLEIGVSTHSILQARAAREAGADYICFGPVFDTPSKRAYGPPLGRELLERAVKELTVPVYAIGGIDGGTLPLIADLPIAGVAVIRAILSSASIAGAVGSLRAAWRSA